jgi:hypothetical protein
MIKPKVQVIYITIHELSSTRPKPIGVYIQNNEEFTDDEIKEIELLVNKRVAEIGLQKYLSNMFYENMVIFREVRNPHTQMTMNEEGLLIPNYN